MVSSGRLRKRKDSQGGVAKLWIFPYVKYNRSQINVSGNVLTLFPETVIYEFESQSDPNALQTQNDDDGGKNYTQSISLSLSRQEDAFDIQKLAKKDYRIIFLDRNGNYRMFGLWNGVESGTLTAETGGSKNSFNGFRIDFNGREEKEAVFLDNLDFFIIDSNEFILQEDGFYLLQEDNFKIKL